MSDAKMPEITPAEWELMRIVWTLGEVTSHQLITLLQRKRDWSESTIKTLLSRLVKKGLLATAKAKRPFLYRATVSELTAMAESADTLFNHLCAMKRGATLKQLVEELPLTQADVASLQAVLAQKAKVAPEVIACDCLPAEMDAQC